MTMPLRYWASTERFLGCDGATWCERAQSAIEGLVGAEYEITGRPETVGEHIVLFVRAGEKEHVVKVFAQNKDGASDFIALKAVPDVATVVRHWERNGLHAALMAPLRPGGDLSALVADGRDREATDVFCDRMCRVAGRSRFDNRFVEAGEWLKDLDRPIGHPATDGLLADARAVRDELLSGPERCLLHGDLHHSNLLKSGTDWVAIDPQGVNAPIEMECGAFLRNPLGLERYWLDLRTFESRRDQIADRCGWDKHNVAGWAFVVSLSSAVWDRVNRDPCPTFEQAAGLWRTLL